MKHEPGSRLREALWRYGAGAVALLLMQSMTARADEPMPLPRIAASAEAAVQARLPAGTTHMEVQAEPLDERLRLAACATALETFIGGDGAIRDRTGVGVRCNGPIRWTLYVMVHISSEVQVLTARANLVRGYAPTTTDFTASTRRVAGLPTQFVSNSAALEGQRLRRPVAAGSALSYADLMPLPLVRRGQTVILLAAAHGIEVRVSAIALADGAADERIRVQSLPAHREIEAIVRGTGLVEVPL